MSGTNVKYTVEETIGEEYMEWRDVDWVFINAPTGSGKTMFIVKTLLPFLCYYDKKILYLVNRRILKEQLENTIMNLPYEYRTEIRIELYQNIEEYICNPFYEGKGNLNENDKLIELEKYDCVVCDECHYFLTDSNYNTYTELSFRWIKDKFQHKLCVFMSATINDIQSYIKKMDTYRDKDFFTSYYHINLSEFDLLEKINGRREGFLHKKMKSYEIERNYDYVDINIIQNRGEIVNVVTEGKDKWLIFVDKVKFGKKLESAIKRRFYELGKGTHTLDVKNRVVMISSGYKQDNAGKEAVDRIIRSSVQSAQVLIATSVLDNGVNINDVKLRNIVIIADTETEFIQMLGRKREDGQRLNLYIYEYDKNHFYKRKQQLDRIKKIVDDYLKYIEQSIKELKKKNKDKSWSDAVNGNYADECEQEHINRKHLEMMYKVSNNHIRYDDISRIFYAYKGVWYLSLLARQNVENLSSYYQNIINKFENGDENAFLREQLRWLGKTDDEANKIILSGKESKLEKSRNKVISELEKIIGEGKSKADFTRFRESIRAELKVVIQNPLKEITDEEGIKDWETYKSEVARSGKPISRYCMDFLRKYCEISFIVLVKHSIYTVMPCKLGDNN